MNSFYSKLLISCIFSILLFSFLQAQVDLQADSSNFQGKVTIDGTFENRGMVYPAEDGQIDQVLSTDGNGQLFWTDPFAVTGYEFLCQNPSDHTVQTFFGQSSDSCGYIYDSGGEFGPYSNDENLNFSILATDAILTRVILLDLATEVNRDTLWIQGQYYTGTIASPDTLIFDGGSTVLIEFQSDNINVDDGFKIYWDRFYYEGDSVTAPFAGFYFDPIKSSVGGGVNINQSWEKSGEKSVFFGYDANAAGLNSSAVGSYNHAEGQNSAAFGYANIAMGHASSAFGNSNSIEGFGGTAIGSNNHALGQGSTAMGIDNQTAGDTSLAVGYNNQADAVNCAAVGVLNNANGFASSAVGYDNDALGLQSSTFGNSNTASGEGSTALGYSNEVTAAYGSAIGYENSVSALRANAFGYNTTSNVFGMTVLGHYNQNISGSSTSWVLTEPIFVVGTGSSFLSKANGLVMLKNGNTGLGTNAPSYRLQLSSNSAAKPTSNVWTVASDARLKTDVEPYREGLEAISAIEPVWFSYTGAAEMPEDRGIGVIAQDLQHVAPYMVSEWSYVHPENGEKTDYLGVDNGAMTYMLINAVKELKMMIEEQKRTNREQRELIADQQAALETLKKSLSEQTKQNLDI